MSDRSGFSWLEYQARLDSRQDILSVRQPFVHLVLCGSACMSAAPCSTCVVCLATASVCVCAGRPAAVLVGWFD